MSSSLQKIFSALLFSTVLVACTTAPPTRFYLLESISPPSTVQADSPKKYTIGLGPVSIPAMLERKQIVTRSEQNAVQIAEFHQWAEPLQDNITRVLAQNLAALHSRHVIRSYPWNAYGPVNYRVIIDIDRFDTQPGHSASLVARWAVRDEKTGSIVVNRKTGIDQPLADSSYPATARALSTLLYEFCRELSGAVDELN